MAWHAGCMDSTSVMLEEGDKHCMLAFLIVIVKRRLDIIGASLSEPHTSVTALRKCVCIRACLLACGHIP